MNECSHDMPIDRRCVFCEAEGERYAIEERNAIIEECARVCDLLAGLNVQGWGRKSTSAAHKCAKEIRALKETAPQVPANVETDGVAPLPAGPAAAADEDTLPW